jgi:hypothetical protein
MLIAAIADEEFATGPQPGGDAQPSVKLSKEEKLAKLASWVK